MSSSPIAVSKTGTQGMVLVEAMASGKPVIALDASGTREVVEDGLNGRLLKEDVYQDDFARAVYEDLLKAYACETTASDELLPWEKLRRAIKTEWDLIAGKARVSVESLDEGVNRDGERS